MELFRHYFTPQEWATSVFYQQHLNDFGFCSLDGSMITSAWNDYAFIGRYKYDSRGEVYISNETTQGSPNRFGSPGCFPYLSDNHYSARRYYAGVTSSGTYDPEAYPATVFFIPLINKGFFLHIRTNNIATGSQEDITITSNDTRDKTFSINTPTPSLNIRVYGNNSAMGKGDGNGVLNLIGLPPSTGNPNYWTYLLYTRNGRMSGSPWAEDPNYVNSLIDYGNGRVTDMPFRSEYLRGQDISNESSIYTNVNPNVCALIKMPFDTGYIDNLYLLATAPKALTDATFFSFNGRNFLNVFDNYVVELPSTTN